MSQRLNLEKWFGTIDIYLFDQLLKGTITPEMRILDAGCGDGRNLRYFLKSGYDVSATDFSPVAISYVRRLAAELAPHLPPENFRVEKIEEMTFPSDAFGVVISSAVLHFAKDEDHFTAMVQEMWRVLVPGGMLFARLASSIGLQQRPHHLGGRRYRLPGESEWFLVDEPMLTGMAGELHAELAEPLKTTIVQNIRCMTTWILRKT